MNERSMNEMATTSRRAWRAARVPLLPLLSVFSLALGCGGDGLEPEKPLEPSKLYWELAVNHRAVTLGLHAPYDALPLDAVPRTATGQAISDLPAPVYTSLDQSKVAVSPDGILHAVDVVSDPIMVVASLTVGNVRHADTVRVRVVDVEEPPVLTTFSVQPIPPDSAKVAFGWLLSPALVARAEDAAGAPMGDLLVAFRSSDRFIATIDPVTGVIGGNRPGKVVLHASATAFGVPKADSVLYRIGMPILSEISGVGAPAPGTVYTPDFSTRTVGVGTVVFWMGKPSEGFRIEFDDDDLPNIVPGTMFSEIAVYPILTFCSSGDFDCNPGNIDAAPSESYYHGAIRVFTAPGVYDYRCPTCGNGGRIIVVDERTP